MFNIDHEWMRILDKYNDSPQVFKRTGVYTILSTCFGQFYDFPDIWGMRPNTWFINSCEPGFGRRSTILNYTNHTIYHAMKQFYDKEKFKDAMNGLSIETGTEQGILDTIIAGRELDIDNFLLCSPEFGGILKKMCASNEGVDVLLSKLYYGERHADHLSRREGKPSRYLDRGYYVSMFSSMQEPGLYLTKSMNRQGLLRRIKIAYVKPTDVLKDAHIPPIGRKTKQVWAELENLGINIGKQMKIVNKTRRGELLPLEVNQECTDIINGIETQGYNNVLTHQDDESIYRQTHWEYVVKIAGLTALNRTFGMIPVVIKKDTDTAELILNDVDRNIGDILKGLNISAGIKQKMENRDIIVRRIKNFKKTGCFRNDISKYMYHYGVIGDYLSKLLQELLKDGTIEILRPDSNDKRKKPRYIYAGYM